MDDDSNTRIVFTSILKQMGFEVECVANGKDALKKYKKAQNINQPFDVVILDLNIPGGMDGLEVYRKLTNLNPEIRAYLTSGYLDDSIWEECTKSGFKGFLNKPIRVEDLQKILVN